MSLTGDLCLGRIERIVKAFGLTEVLVDGGPALPLHSCTSGGRDGVCRVWQGDPLSRMVYIGLESPSTDLDSHMVFAFTPPDSIIPHFTLDSVAAQGVYAFHLDLIPRVDLGANLEHMDEVFEPLTDTFHAFGQVAGWRRARLTPRQRALMSPWMLAHHGTPEAFAGLDPVVDAYLDHWCQLLEVGVSEPLERGEPARRDRHNRAALFSPEVDRVWDSIKSLVDGSGLVQARSLLRGDPLAQVGASAAVSMASMR